MTDLSITATDVKLVRAFEQLPNGPSGEALNAGEVLRLDTSTGYYTPANGTTAAEAKAIGVGVETATYAGQTVTLIKRGLVDLGDALDALDYGAPIFLSDTDGTLADTPGTVARRIGIVWPGFAATTADKLLLVDVDAAEYQDGVGYIGLPLTQWREAGSNDIQNLAAHGGILAKDSNPILEYTSGDTDSALRLYWAAADVEKIVTQTPLPPDLDEAQAITLHARAAIVGTGGPDTVVLTLESFFNEGDTKVSDTTAAVTGTTVAEYTATIAAADVPAGAQTLSMEITPAAHGTDVLVIYALWLEYGKVSA